MIIGSAKQICETGQPITLLLAKERASRRGLGADGGQPCVMRSRIETPNNSRDEVFSESVEIAERR